MNNFEQDYFGLVEDALKYGEMRESRVGQTRSCFGTALRIKTLRDGQFPILTSRKIFYKPVLGELAAFLCGASRLTTFQRFGCNYWNENAAKWTGNLGLAVDKCHVGKVYGAQWRRWTDTSGGGDDYLDQLDVLIDSIKNDPYGRRHILTTWNPAELQLGCLPPCHILAQFNVTSDGFLDVCVYMRSVDLCLGLPSDIILYATLLLLVAQQVDKEPGTITFFMGDTHVYENHIAAAETQIVSPTFALPTWILDKEATVDNFRPADLVLPDYTHGEVLRYELNV